MKRRTVLRAAGVALTLPFFESLVPRPLRAQAVAGPRRFLPIYLPNGAHEFWRPPSAGRGDAWQLSSILEPFGAALKPKLTVVSNLENASVFSADAVYLENSHGRLGGAWLTCVDAKAVRAALGLEEANGVSVDQVMAAHAAFKGISPLDSLQLGLSTPLGNCDAEPCSSSRSVSWASATQPLYKVVDPLEVFNQLVSVAGPADATSTSGIEAQKRYARNQSVLDAVLENAQRIRKRLGSGDRPRMDEFLDSVRAVERKATGVSNGMGRAGCLAMPQDLGSVDVSGAPRQNTEAYDKGAHADAMNELIALAFQCDLTRIISLMLEDERSEFTYDHVKLRTFTDAQTGSVEKDSGATCSEYHAAQHEAAGDDFATITWWNVGKVAELCQSLDAIEESPGVSVLDNTVVFLGACMHGSNHNGDQLPVALVGGGNLGLAGDQHVVLEARPLRDLYFTLLNDVFGLGIDDFGQNVKGAPPAKLAELLKT
ncbi:MAG TPA: DUF1552 domain-containing protein [Polyangiaceae bacterium]|nr:DUF1552 domain-containing protein [Polyangiaceae bacterium]